MLTRPGAKGAVLLLFDIADAAREEHDDWHTHEHMPERLGIPGFLRGSRWTASSPGPRYCVLYEVASLDVLDSPAYSARLEDPTPWTSSMMKHYVDMHRTLCSISAREGRGLGTFGCLVRFMPGAGREQELDEWLCSDVLPELSRRPGLSSNYLLHNAVNARMTNEQEIRGRDASIHSALLVTGYDENAVAALRENELAAERLTKHGCSPSGYAAQLFRQSHSATAAELG